LLLRTFEGTHYEIGYRLGRGLVTLNIPESDSQGSEFAVQCEAIAREVYPPILEKVEGLIEGSRLSAQDFKTYFYTRGGPPQIGCTNLAIMPPYTKEGFLLLGGNYDWFYSAREWREVRVIRPQGAYSHISVTHHWAGSPDALNERGVAVLLSVLPEREVEKPGLQWHLVIDILMETCGRLEEAREFITSVPHLRAFNYLIADEHQAIVAEATPDGVLIREPEDGLLVATNHLPGREFPEEALTEIERLRQRRSLTRYKRVHQMMGERPRGGDLEAVKAILRDHEAPVCRGDHPPVEERGGFDSVFGTIWSLICQPGRREILLAAGHPCNSEYERCSL